MTGTPSVRLEHVSKTYVTEEGVLVHAVIGVTFTVGEGEFVSLLGPSGCGKSTCLRIIDGVESFDPGSVVEVQGRPVIGPGPDRARIFQHFAILPWRTVLENVALGLKWQGVPRREREARARHFLDLMGLNDFAQRYPRELSGGMRQRVGIARALALDPALLLADEPFASVDALTREVLQDELLRIWSKTRKTVVFVTHSIDEALYLSDRILLFGPRPGRVVEELAVPFLRPRDHSVRKDPAFGELRDRIWQMLSDSRALGPPAPAAS